LDDLNILIKAKIDAATTNINKQIKDLQKQVTTDISVKLKVDAKDLTMINDTMEKIKKATSQSGSSKIKIFNEQYLKDQGIKYKQGVIKTIEDVEKYIKGAFNGKKFDLGSIITDSSGNIKSFEASIKSANNQLEKVKFNLAEISKLNAKGITSTTSGYVASDSKLSRTPIKTEQIFDRTKLEAEGRQFFVSASNIIERVKKEFKSLGDVDVTFLKNSKQEITGFIANVTRASGVIEKLKFDMAKIASGNSIQRGYVFSGENLIDNNAGSNIQKALDKLQLYENKIAKLKSGFTSPATGIKDDGNLSALVAQYDKIKLQIDQTRNSSTNLSNEQRRGFVQSIANLELEIAKYRDLQRIIATTNTRTLSASDISLYQGNMANKLSSLQVGKDTVFARPEIQAEMTRLTDGVARFGTVGGKSARELNLQFAQLTTSVRSATNEITRINGAADSFLTTLSKNFGKMIAWGLVATALYAPLRSLQAGLTTLKELDGLMVNIAKVTNLSAEAMNNLKDSAFEASNAFGRTAQDYLKSIGEFSRAGYEGKAEDLAKVSLLSQNVGELTAEQANGFLLATDAAYKYKGSEEELMKVLDGANIIDNKFATSISKISEGIMVAGSISANASVGINELSAAVGTMTAITQKSGNEAGRAFRGILMNIRQIKGETEDGDIIDDEALSKSAKALDSVGIKVHEMRNGIEELRNPMSVLEDLSRIWSGLSSMKTAPIIESLGGKYRGNQLVALVENFDMYKSMLQEYSTASGSAMAENEVRMGSWETKINQLRNSINNFWNNTIDTSLVKSMIGGITLLINNFGNLRTILGIIFTILSVNKGTAFLTFLKNFSASTMLLNSSLVQTQARLAGMSFAQIGMMSTTTSLTFAIKGLWAAMLANPIGLVIGAVTAIIMIFDFMGASAEKSAKKQKEAFDELSRSINSLKQQTAEAKNLANQYESLSSITSRTADEETKLAEVKDRLIAQFPDLIEGYDSEGKAIIGSSESIKQAIKDNEELLKIKQEQMSNTFITDGSNNFSQLQKDQKRLDLLTKHKEEYLKIIDDINNGKQVQFDAYGNDSLVIAKNNLKGIKDELPTLSSKVLESRKDLSSLADSFLKSSDSAQSLGKEAITKLIYDLSSLKDEAKITGEQFTNIFDGLEKSDFSSKLNEAKTKLEELVKSGVSNDVIKSSYESAISELSPYLEKLGSEGEVTGIILKNMLNMPSAQEAKEKIDKVTVSLSSLIKSSKDSTDSIKEYNQILYDQSNGQEMSIEKALELISANEKMADAISIVNGAVVINIDVIKTLRQAEIDAVTAKVTGSNKSIDAQIADTQATISATQIRINEINKEIEAINKLNAAKLSVREDEKGNYLSTNTSDSMASQAKYDLGNSQAQLNRLMNLKTFENGISSPNYGVSEPKDKKDKSSPTTPLSEFVSIEESLIRSFLTESKITEESNKLLEKQLQIAKSAKDYNKELTLSRQLIEGETKQISQLSQARSKMEDEFAKVSSEGGYSVRETLSWFDNKGEDTLAYQTKFKNSSVETRKTMNMTHDELQKLEKAYHETGVSIDTLTDSLVALKNSLTQIEIGKFEQSLSDLDKKINLSKSIMDLYDKSSEEYAKEQAKQITILKEKEDAIFNEIVTIGHLLKATDLTTESQKALNDEMANLKLTLNQNQKSMQDYANNIVQTLKDAAKIKKEIDISVINVEMISEDRRHQQVLDDIDSEEKAREDSINAQISAIDRLADAENYDKNLNKSQSEVQVLQNEQNYLVLDTSNEGRARSAELQKQLDEKNSEIDDMQNSHTNDLRKQNLQDALDAIKKESDAKKKSEDDAYDAKKKSLDDQKTATETAFNELMLNDEIWSAKVQEILDGNIEGIKTSLNTFANEFTNTLTEKAGEIDTSFQAIINTIKQIKSAANELDAFPNYASGTKSHPGGLAKISELGPELITTPDGHSFLSGNNGPEIVNLPKDSEVLPADLTKKLLNKSSIPAYATGIGNLSSNSVLADILSKVDISNLLNSVSVPSFSVPQFQAPQMANNVSTSTTNNLNPVFNITVPKGTTRSQVKEIADGVFKEFSKMIKK